MYRHIAILILVLSGCAGPQDEVAQSAFEQGESIPVLSRHELNITQNLTLEGSSQVAGVYAHDNYALGHYNCFGYEIRGVPITRIKLQATWPSSNALEERIDMFHWFKDETGPVRDVGYVNGASPLKLEAEVETTRGADWLTVGVQPRSDLPAAVGTIKTVAVQLEIEYEGENVPELQPLTTCVRQNVLP